ncbi:MAG: cyclic nucleotide-binding domain-containing protein [Gammaproteobacteria bacterium]
MCQSAIKIPPRPAARQVLHSNADQHRCRDPRGQSERNLEYTHPTDFDTLHAMAVLDLCKTLPVRTFGPGEVVLAEGQRTGLLYILVSGTVEVVKGEIRISTVSEPGAFFGEMSVLLDAPHMATVRTIESSTFHVTQDPLGFLRSTPALAMDLSRVLARKLHFVTTYLADLKRQFEGSGDHLAMVDEVLESLLHHQEAEASPGSDRYPDPTLD